MTDRVQVWLDKLELTELLAVLSAAVALASGCQQGPDGLLEELGRRRVGWRLRRLAVVITG